MDMETHLIKNKTFTEIDSLIIAAYQKDLQTLQNGKHVTINLNMNP